ncbi:hypothetical protein HMPREF9131_1498, partial [Peptoniphilus sp. oral taxon 836 str. F0141]
KDLIDFDKELQRLEKELKDAQSEMKRAQGKLNNKGFVEKAPQKLVDEEKAKIEKYSQIIKKIEENIGQIKNR